MKEYGKFRYIPESCPVCGAIRFDLAPKDSLNDLFKAYYTGLVPKLMKNHWGVYRWYASCGKCILNEQLSQPSFLQVLAGKAEKFQGQQIKIEFRR